MAATVYDVARGRLVLLAGLTVGRSTYAQDTWLWDGETWLEATGAGPAARRMQSLTYDEERGRSVLFGGIGAATELLGDTWERRSPVWVRADTGDEAPEARAGHAAAWARHAGEEAGRVFVFGGCAEVRATDGDVQCDRALADTWAWDGRSWELLDDGVCGPGPRWRHAVAYDAGTGRTWLFGGMVDSDRDGDAEVIRRDLWLWDGARWEVHNTDPRPGYCFDGAMAPLEALGDAVLFGGIDRAGERSRTTWTWDGEGWVDHVGNDDGRPPPRAGHSLVHDPLRARTILAWGMGDGYGSTSLHDWDGATWRRTTSADEGAPLTRMHAGVTFDAERGRMIAFGGDVVGFTAEDTWEWDCHPDQRPASLLDVDFGFEGADLADIVGLTVRAVAGGQGYALDLDPDDDGDIVGEAVPGVELMGWDAREGRWTSLAVADHPPDAPGELTWYSPDAATARRFLRQRALAMHFALRPAAGEGNGPDRPVVVTDYVEARVGYRWPLPPDPAPPPDPE